MKRFSIFGIAAILTSLFCMSCDDHIEFPDSTMTVGHVLCTDGSVLSQKDFDVSNKEAIAVVFYINHDSEVEGKGYAVYLNDIKDCSFADECGVSVGTSCSLTAHDGNTNTYEMFTNGSVNSALAVAVFDMWKYGQSAYIPSVMQMRLLYSAKDVINPIIEKYGGDTIPSDPDKCWYWTSTEVEGQDAHKAWLYSLASGAIQETPKNEAHGARPILTLND